MQVVFVLSSWASGSSAVAGFLGKCGCYTCPPHFSLLDPRTPNSFESTEYRDALMACIDENSLERISPTSNFVAFLSDWLPAQIQKAEEQGYHYLVLKHPLQSFLLDEITKIVKPIFVVVTRPLEKIEQTRRRRDWGPVYGSAGAKSIYSAIYSYLHNNSKCYLAVPYEEFRNDVDMQRHLIDYCSIKTTDTQIHSASTWLRHHTPPVEDSELRYELEMTETLNQVMARAKQLEEQAFQAETRASLAEAQIAALKNSNSWRITAPVRAIVAFLRGDF